MDQNSAEHCDHRVKSRRLSPRSPQPEISVLWARERLGRLPDRCAMLVAGFDNADDDAELVFRDLPYPAVMELALHHRVVRDALALLPADFTRWSRP